MNLSSLFNIKSAFSATTFAAIGFSIGAVALSGCADSSDAPGVAAEKTAATKQAASSVPPPNAGNFSLIGEFHMKNGTGVCATVQGNLLTTAPCAEDAAQKFAAYSMPDGTYNLCVPGSITVGFLWNHERQIQESAEDEVPEGAVVLAVYANCLGRGSDSEDLRIRRVGLSYEEGGVMQTSLGAIVTEGDNSSGFLLAIRGSSRKFQRVDNLVVLKKKSSGPERVWTFY